MWRYYKSSVDFLHFYPLRIVFGFVLVVLFFFFWQQQLHKSPVPPHEFTFKELAATERYRSALGLALAPPVCTPDCVMQPGQYHPSTLEKKWASGAEALLKDGFCSEIAKELATWQQWLDEIAGQRSVELGGRKGLVSLQHKESTRVVEWSYISLKSTSSSGSEVHPNAVFLEPLAGFLRDPRTSCPGIALKPAFEDSSMDSKAITYLDPVYYNTLANLLREPLGSGRPRAFLFDLGSSSWQASNNAYTANGFSWLVKAYGEFGIEFDELFAWEAKVTPAEQFFAGMPSNLVVRTHFYNIPVTASSKEDGPSAALNLLKLIAQPRDFVVFKLDIDTEMLEENIALSILESDELSSLVDDFYFEQHVSTGGVMDPWWGDGSVYHRSTAESIALFQALRRRGIRAHSWP